jgi:hypothetical protein
MERICKNCKHYGNMTAGAGLCQRTPPTIVYDGSFNLTRSIWPEVAHDDFCGEWKSKVTTVRTTYHATHTFDPPKGPKVCPNCLQDLLIQTDLKVTTCLGCNHKIDGLIDPPKEEPKEWRDHRLRDYRCPRCLDINQFYIPDLANTKCRCNQCNRIFGFYSWEEI